MTNKIYLKHRIATSTTFRDGLHTHVVLICSILAWYLDQRDGTNIGYCFSRSTCYCFSRWLQKEKEAYICWYGHTRSIPAINDFRNLSSCSPRSRLLSLGMFFMCCIEISKTAILFWTSAYSITCAYWSITLTRLFRIHWQSRSLLIRSYHEQQT